MKNFDAMKRSFNSNTITIETARKHLDGLKADLMPEDDLVIRNRIWQAMDNELDVLRRAENSNAMIVRTYAAAIKDMLKNRSICITVTSCAEFGWTGHDHAMVDSVLSDGTVMAHNCHGERYVLRMGDHFAPYHG